MNNYKHFIAGLTNVALGTVHIKTAEDDGIKSYVSSFVKLIEDVKYVDGSYYTYYGEIKSVLEKFFIYWRETMDETVKRADKLLNEPVNKEKLLTQIVNTIRLWKEYKNNFYAEFLPIESTQQQKIYDDLEEKFKLNFITLDKMKKLTESFDQMSKIKAFSKQQCARAVESKISVFRYAHEYLSLMLADHLTEISGSLRENLSRLLRNVKDMENRRETKVNKLLYSLYEKQKELMVLMKNESQTGLIEQKTSIKKIRKKVVKSGNHDTIWQLKSEVELFERRLADFNRIGITLTVLKQELEKTYKEESIYNARNTTELPGSKFECWNSFGRNFEKRKEELKMKILEASKTLTTFFVVRCMIENIMTYENDMARFSVDGYGHQVYHLSYGLKKRHVDCLGNLRKIDHNKEDYYDYDGRYFLDNDNKMYQLSDCTSLYELGDDTLLKKVTVDCGHSKITKEDCGMNIKNVLVDVILPTTKPVNIKETLHSDVVEYLWDQFGGVLPDALYEVCELKPKNPIHCLARALLKQKYEKCSAECIKKNAEAQAYRANILKEKKDKVVGESLAWKAKQVKRRKPEESDDSYNRALYDIYVATNQFIASLDCT